MENVSTFLFSKLFIYSCTNLYYGCVVVLSEEWWTIIDVGDCNLHDHRSCHLWLTTIHCQYLYLIFWDLTEEF